MSSNSFRHRGGRLAKKKANKPPNVVKSHQDTEHTGWLKLLVVSLLMLPGLSVVGLLVFVESNVDPQPYSLPSPPALDGVLEPNDHLVVHGRRLYENKVHGPESIAHHKGYLYTGTSDGKILRIDSAAGTIKTLATLGQPPCGGSEFEHMCGRPLGMRIYQGTHLLVLDAYLGFFKVHLTTGATQLLMPASLTVDGGSFRFLNDLTVSADGTVYFTDSSRFHRREYHLDMLEHSPTGRLLKHSLSDNTTQVLLDHLYFPNGVQLSKDESYLLFSETTKARVLKYHLTGAEAGQTEVFIDNLPGLVDNVRASSRGGYWFALPSCRHASSFSVIDFLGQYPGWRRQLAKIPLFITKAISPMCSMILETDQQGNIIRSLQDLRGQKLQFISEVEEVNGTLYTGSFSSPYMGKIHLSEII